MNKKALDEIIYTSTISYTLYIPFLENTITKNFIKNIFKKLNIGIISSIKITQQNKVNSAIINFNYWNFNNPSAMNLARRIMNGCAKFIYDDPKYWLLCAIRNKFDIYKSYYRLLQIKEQENIINLQKQEINTLSNDLSNKSVDYMDLRMQIYNYISDNKIPENIKTDLLNIVKIPRPILKRQIAYSNITKNKLKDYNIWE